MDRHAQLDTTSVYASARVFSMLAECLSNDLAWLKQQNRRCTAGIRKTPLTGLSDSCVKRERRCCISGWVAGVIAHGTWMHF